MNGVADVNSIPSDAWVHGLFERPLRDLGHDGDDLLSKIYSPGYSQELIRRFMTEYYESIEGARAQAAKLDLTDYYRALIAEALEISDFKPADPACATVLEIGCGFGSATFPLLELMPQARLVATELSTSMLIVLKEKLQAKGIEHRCALMQLNAEELNFKPGTFDLIVGAAVLHHLFSPATVIEQCAALLKPGGIAVFFEPFENGFSIMGIIFRTILRDPRRWLLSRKARYFFRFTFNRWQEMKTADKNDPLFSGSDDKWLFTREYFTRLAKKYNFSGVHIHSLNKSSEPFFQFAQEQVNGNGVGKLPQWAWTLIRDFDHLFSQDLKMDLLTEGCIILKK